MIELKVRTLEIVEGAPLVRVTLQEAAGDRQLHIWVGLPEASAIQSQLEGNKPPRPMTHDLMASILSTLQAKILQLLISDMKEETFFGMLAISMNGRVHEIDCRPSDGIALALRAAAPIFIEDELLAEIERLHEAQELHAPHPGAVVVDREDTTIH